MTKSFLRKVKQQISNGSLGIVLLIFVLYAILESSHFFPDLRDINIWDEANYIKNGYLLLTQNQWPDLAGSPLSSVLYALTTLPFLNSPDFFVLSDAFGRILLFSLIFFSAYLIARALRPYTNPWVMVGFVFVVPVATTMFLYPSDVLFAGLSGLAFWQMLLFYQQRLRKHLWLASLFMGLGMLARAEGLLLIGVMLIITLMIDLHRKHWYRSVIAILVPFIIFTAGYVLIIGAVTGDFGTGLSGRTFNNFESGQESIYSQTGIFTPTISARLESREAFGGPEENDLSVFRAISRNPDVYFQRLRLAPRSFANMAIKAYGNKFILIFIWLSLRGVIALIREKHWPLAVMGILWFAPLGVGFLNTFFREGYFMMPYFVVFAFSCIGLTTIIKNLSDPWEKLGLLSAGLLVLLIGLISQNTSMVYRSVLFFLGLGIIYLITQKQQNPARREMHALWAILAVGLIMRGGYPSPELPNYGRSDLEKSVYFLQDSLPERSDVLAGSPAYIWAAKMTYYGINSYDIPDFADEQDFLGWIESQGIDAVYVDQHFPDTFKPFVKSLSNSGLQEVFSTPERDILIFLVSDPVN